MDQAAVDCEITQMTDAQVSEELVRACRERDRLDLRIAGLAARFATGCVWDDDGSVSAIDWIRFNCHMTSNAAADVIAVGKNLPRMPNSVQAIAQGEIGFAHAKAMARTADAVGAMFDEGPLLEKAPDSSPGKFYYICNHYRHAADRKGYEAEQAELVENRRLWIIKCDDGNVLLNGVFDPEGGAALITTLEPLARKSGADDYRSRENGGCGSRCRHACSGLRVGPAARIPADSLECDHFSRDPARPAGRTCGRAGVLAASDLGQNGRAARL